MTANNTHYAITIPNKLVSIDSPILQMWRLVSGRGQEETQEVWLQNKLSRVQAAKWDWVQILMPVLDQ